MLINEIKVRPADAKSFLHPSASLHHTFGDKRTLNNYNLTMEKKTNKLEKNLGGKEYELL